LAFVLKSLGVAAFMDEVTGRRSSVVTESRKTVVDAVQSAIWRILRTFAVLTVMFFGVIGGLWFFLREPAKPPPDAIGPQATADYQPTGSGGYSGGSGTVHVSSYSRANGTQVQSYTRSAPSHSGGHGGHGS
jgi:hypothetical protein